MKFKSRLILNQVLRRSCKWALNLNINQHRYEKMATFFDNALPIQHIKSLCLEQKLMQFSVGMIQFSTDSCAGAAVIYQTT
jgi:hypothetical protein